MPDLLQSNASPSEPAEPAEPVDPAEPTALAIETARRRLRMTWQDGHTSIYPWWFLRGFCPCAACQGHGGPYTYHPPATDAAHALEDVREVGNYAVNLTWADGHKTGIYGFDLLRRLCACPACRDSQALTPLWGQLGAADQARFAADVGG